jgi:hypothetical protein
VLNKILCDVFVTDSDFVNANHDAPYLRNRCPSKSVRFVERLQPPLNIQRLYGGGGTPTSIISGWLYFEKSTLKLIAQLLPKLILIKAEQARSLALHTTLQLLASEMSDQAPGSEVVANRLAEVLFIQAIRAHVASGADCRNPGWLRAIFDPQIGRH